MQYGFRLKKWNVNIVETNIEEKNKFDKQSFPFVMISEVY